MRRLMIWTLSQVIVILFLIFISRNMYYWAVLPLKMFLSSIYLTKQMRLLYLNFNIHLVHIQLQRKLYIYSNIFTLFFISHLNQVHYYQFSTSGSGSGYASSEYSDPEYPDSG